MLSRFFNPKHSDAVRLRIVGAFPRSLTSDVEKVLDAIPVAKHAPSSDDIGLITLEGESLNIPFRIYFPEPNQISLVLLTKLQRAILTCLYTRHHDGRVREKYLREIIGAEERWVIPFVLQLAGEYIIEIIKFLDQNSHQLKRENYSSFVKANPAFCLITSQRIFSYWSCYFRHDPPFFNEHCGFMFAKEIGLWDEGVAKKMPKRKPVLKTG